MSAFITLIPIGPPPASLIPWLATRLPQTLGRDVVVGEGIPRPAAGYNPYRRQYWGEALLAALRALPYPGTERALGLADADCYVPGLNFILVRPR
jgi:predicted Zn-dependent protease